MVTRSSTELNILLIDHYDSFTFNLFQLLCCCGSRPTVVAYDQISLKDIKKFRPSGIVFSAGPGRPEPGSLSMEVIRHLCGRVPMLGVCLGHQYIGTAFGCRVVRAQRILHGETSAVYHTGTGIFKSIANPFTAARYHSLALDRVPRNFYLSAWAEDGEIMGIAHLYYPVFGVQFHPESFMTKQGSMLIRNFLHVCRRTPL